MLNYKTVIINILCVYSLFGNDLFEKEYLADLAAKDIQKVLDNNGGSIKVAPAVYMDRVMKYKDLLAIYFTYDKAELLENLVKRNIDHIEAVNILNSQAFIDTININQKKYWLNNYCNTKPISELINRGVVLNLGLLWDDRTTIINNFRIDKKSCALHNK